MGVDEKREYGGRDNNGWDEWRHYVLENLKSNNTKLDELTGIAKRLEIEMSAIKIKSGLLGTIAGAVGGAIAVFGKTLLGGGGK
jgi:hypothetical protein